MRKVRRLILAAIAALAASLAVARTDNPVSRIFQRREAVRLGFVASTSSRADLEAYRAARRRCEGRWDVRPPEAKRGDCRRCVVSDCLTEEAGAYRARDGSTYAPGPDTPLR